MQGSGEDGMGEAYTATTCSANAHAHAHALAHALAHAHAHALSLSDELAGVPRSMNDSEHTAHMNRKAEVTLQEILEEPWPDLSAAVTSTKIH